MDLMFIPYQNPKDYDNGQVPMNILARSHVARLQHRRARMLRVAQTSDSTRRIVAEGWKRTPSAAGNPNGQGDDGDDGGEQAESSQNRALFPSASTSTSGTGRSEHAQSGRLNRKSRVPTSAISGPRYHLWRLNAASDTVLRPPSPSTVDVNAQILAVLQYYLKFSLVGTFRIEAITIAQPVEKHRWYGLIQYSLGKALANETYLYTILAGITARMAHIAVSGPHYARLADLFMYRATKSLRQWLSTNTIDDTSKIFVIANIFHLAMAEWYRHNLEASSVHMSQVKSLIDTFFATEGLDKHMSWFRLFLGMVDTLMSLETFEPPNFPAPWRPPRLSTTERGHVQRRLIGRISQKPTREMIQYHPHFAANVVEEDQLRRKFTPFQEPVGHSKEFEKVLEALLTDTTYKGPTQGFVELVQSGTISQPFSNVIMEDFVPWQEMSHLCWMTTSATTGEAEWINQTGVAIIHQLLSISAVSTASPSWREEAVRLTLIVSVGVLASPLGWRFVDRYASLLKDSLEALEVGKSFKDAYYPSKIEGEVTFWTLCMGLVASTASSSISSDWYRSRAIKLALHLRITSLEAMFETIAKFILPGILRHPCMIELIRELSIVNGGSNPFPLRKGTFPAS